MCVCASGRAVGGMGAWLFVTGRTWHKLWHFICVASNNLTFCMLFLAVYLFLRSTLFEAWWRRGRDRCGGGSRAGEFLDPQSKHWHGEHWAIDLFALSDNPKCQTNNAIAEDSPTDWNKREIEQVEWESNSLEWFFTLLASGLSSVLRAVSCVAAWPAPRAARQVGVPSRVISLHFLHLLLCFIIVALPLCLGPFLSSVCLSTAFLAANCCVPLEICSAHTCHMPHAACLAPCHSSFRLYSNAPGSVKWCSKWLYV